MSTPLFSIGGVASGLDTDAIISQLMQLERVPVVRFQQQQAKLRAVDDAWGEITTKLSAVRTAVDTLRSPSGWAGMVRATSSQPESVAVSASAGATPGSSSFTVERLAAAHQVVVGGDFASGDAVVGAGEFSITRPDGSIATVTTVEDTTLTELASKVSALGAGVSAQVLKTGESVYRLVLTADETGAANTFTTDTALAGLDTSEVLNQGVDAHLKLGTLDVYRSSNTVTDLFDGVTLDLKRTTTDPVVVTTEHDVDKAVENVKGLVDGLNGALTLLKDLSAYDPQTRQGGLLQGNGTVRRLVSDLRTAVSSAVEGLAEGLRHGSGVGMGLDRYGAVTLDETKLRAALSADFDGVVGLFSRAGASADARVSYVSSSTRTTAGSYDVEITQAASAAAATGAGYTAADRTLVLTSGGSEVTVDLATTDDLASAVTKINDALAAAGVTTLAASADGGALRLAESRYGSAASFGVTGSDVLGLDGEHAGTDVAGTIGGQAATGRGRTLTGAGGDVEGLVLTVTAGAGDVGQTLGPVAVTSGIAGALDAVLTRFEGSGGLIASARESLSTRIRQFDDRIAAFEVRLESRETTLRRQFTALESAMGRLQSQSAWMASQISSLNAQSG